MKIFEYPLDKNSKYVVLDPASTNIPIHELDNRVTFFKIHDDNIDHIYFSNCGYILRVTDDGYKKYLPDEKTGKILCEGKTFGVLNLYQEFYFRPELIEAFLPKDKKTEYPSIGYLQYPTDEQISKWYHTYVSHTDSTVILNPKESFDVIRKQFKNAVFTSLALFGFYGQNDKIRQLITNMKLRTKRKKRQAKICPEWTPLSKGTNKGNIDYIVRERLKLWVLANYYYYPGELDLDKDLLCLWQNELIYSPTTSMFIPHYINNFFTDKKIEQIESGNYESEKEYREIVDTIKLYIDREKELQPKINNDAHVKMINVLENILTKISNQHDSTRN